MIKNQLTQQEARLLFDYRDGMLFWRTAGSGRRADLRAISFEPGRARISVGGVRHEAQYAVWNWHHGITRTVLRFRDGNKQNVAIENLEEGEEIISPPSAPTRTECPCCAQSVPVPPAYVVAVNSGLTPMETRILEAVWNGKGRPVQTEKIFDRMYEDDPDGGPSPARMYATFKEKLSLLKKKLNGSGVTVENVGRREGYRLVLGVRE